MNILGPKIKPELAAELIKLVKTPEDLFGPSGLLQEIKKSLMEKLLEVEMDDHLGYDKGEKQAEGQRANSRNGHTEKTVHTESGSVEIRVPRDRDGSFTPKVVPKHVRRLSGFDDKVLALYASGMTTREIQGHLQELYGTDISPQLVTQVTDGVVDLAKAWQSRPLEAVYPVVLPGRAFREHPRRRYGPQKSRLYRAGHDPVGAAGSAGPLVSANRRREVLALGFDRPEKPRPHRHLLRLLRRPHGVARRHRHRVPPGHRPDLHRAHDPRFAALRLVRRPKTDGARLTSDLRRSDRSSRQRRPRCL